MTHAPKGFTRKNPLIVNGKPYVGGQYIPNATQAEIDSAVEKQADKIELPTNHATTPKPADQTPQQAAVAQTQGTAKSKPNHTEGAHQVLLDSGKPMSPKEIADEMLRRGIMDTAAVNPRVSIGTAIRRDIAQGKGRFIQTEKGKFAAVASQPNSAAAKADPEAASVALLHQEEDSIRTLKTHEEIRIVADGKVVFTDKGGQDYCNVTTECMQKMRGAYFTHNHPLGWQHQGSAKEKGSSFSSADIQIALAGRPKEMRAVSPGYRHVLKITDSFVETEYNKLAAMSPAAERVAKAIAAKGGSDGKGEVVWQGLVRQEYEMHQNAVMKEAVKRIMALPTEAARDAAIDEAEANHGHLVNSRLAAQFGWEYRREDYQPWTK